MFVCGVYKIVNTINGKVYIGSSKNIDRGLFLGNNLRWWLHGEVTKESNFCAKN
jgi:hypothetical protein